MSYKEGGWEDKYYIQKKKLSEKCATRCPARSADEHCSYGSLDCPHYDIVPVDTDAVYFVLRLDTDPHARKAAFAYAKSVERENPKFARDIQAKLLEIFEGNVKAKGGKQKR